MAEQPKQDRVWDFATEAYLPSDDEKPATGNTLILGATRVGKTTLLNAVLNPETTRPDADPDLDTDSESAK
jgi:predicted AAA+ superfamily ATPase